MKTITLRNLTPELAAEIERIAAEEHLSLNRTAIRLLEKGAGIRSHAGHEIVHRDLDHLAGSWSDEEAAQFDASLSQQRKIDPEMWE